MSTDVEAKVACADELTVEPCHAANPTGIAVVKEERPRDATVL
jgi:hypothetical protein